MMKLLVPLILMVLSLGAAAGAADVADTAGDRPSIHFLRACQVKGTKITLGEIATLTKFSPSEEKILSKIELGESPAEGKSLKWTALQASEKLRPLLKDFEGAQLRIPETITITHNSNILNEATVRTKLEDIVRGQLPEPTWQFEVRDIKIPQVLQQMKLAGFQIMPPLARAKGAFSFELIAVEHATPHRFWITARVNYFTDVATLLRQIPAHSRFGDTDVRWEKKDVTFDMDVPATPDELKISLARTTLMPGTAIQRSNLEREMALHFGDQVDLFAGDDAISVITKGIAQQNGYIGDRVKIKNLANNKMVDAVVMAPGVVNVRY